jgi:hypothetical protein
MIGTLERIASRSDEKLDEPTRRSIPFAGRESEMNGERSHSISHRKSRRVGVAALLDEQLYRFISS